MQRQNSYTQAGRSLRLCMGAPQRTLAKIEVKVKKTTQQLSAFIFGVVFVTTLLVLAVAVPHPTPFQYMVFRVTLSIAVAGVAAMIPGFLSLTVSGWLRASGAIAVFVIVYFYNPASLIVSSEQVKPTDPFPVVLACVQDGTLTVEPFAFPYSDIKKNADLPSILGLIEQLPGTHCDPTHATVYRMHDEAALQSDGRLDAVSGGNIGVIVIPRAVIEAVGDEHIAFTQALSAFRLQSRENSFFGGR